MELPNPLHVELWQGTQDVGYTAVFRIGALQRRVRVSIRVDSYDFQSYARAEVYSRELDQWQPITSIHFSNMESLRVHDRSAKVGAYQYKIDHHEGDVRDLLKQAEDILG